MPEPQRETTLREEVLEHLAVHGFEAGQQAVDAGQQGQQFRLGQLAAVGIGNDFQAVRFQQGQRRRIPAAERGGAKQNFRLHAMLPGQFPSW